MNIIERYVVKRIHKKYDFRVMQSQEKYYISTTNYHRDATIARLLEMSLGQYRSLLEQKGGYDFGGSIYFDEVAEAIEAIKLIYGTIYDRRG